jgi:hypothetical protein
MQWQRDIHILGVFSDNTNQNAWIFFSNRLGVVGWRQIEPLDAIGVSNIVTIAVAAQYGGTTVRMLITNAGTIVGIQTI